MKKIITLATAIALLTGPVLAQNRNCAPRERVVERLESQYGEGVHARGLAGQAEQSSIVEVWGSAESGTWTITVTNIAGVTCLVASGQAFETLTPAAVVEGDPT